MQDKPFSELSAKNNDSILTARIYRSSSGPDMRNPYEKDYTRIVHSLAYRRLKNKTQVFYNTRNDHICTRIEHVEHVESVATLIADSLGLNISLTKAIAIGHDMGHAPFGHHGEKVLNSLYEKYFSTCFFHERNSLRFADCIELLENSEGRLRNLNLTYAVRDGLISHCGEVNEGKLMPRTEKIPLDGFTRSGQYQPATWEGCIVKMADRISYIGRDLEDAKRTGFIYSGGPLDRIQAIAGKYRITTLNTTNIINRLITDICENSSPQNGIALSDESAAFMSEAKKFNEEYIYSNPRFDYYLKYVELIINSLFDVLDKAYDGPDSAVSIIRRYGHIHPELAYDFADWLVKYSEGIPVPETLSSPPGYDRCINRKIYCRLESPDLYRQAILDYISGMTDRFAIRAFEELITF